MGEIARREAGWPGHAPRRRVLRGAWIRAIGELLSAPAVTVSASSSPPAPLALARTWLTTLLFWPYLLVSSAVLFVFALALFLLTLPFDRRRALLHLYTCAWGYH